MDETSVVAMNDGNHISAGIGYAAARDEGGVRLAPVPAAHSALQPADAVGQEYSRQEQVDVAIVGAGVCGLACAVALQRVRPDCIVKVYEARPNPHQPDRGRGQLHTTAGVSVGGGVRLEANGLKALTAISRRLAADVMTHGLFAHRVILHDTEAGTVITHLQKGPHLHSPSPRQPALVVGWTELEQLLLDQLLPDTVQWEAVATNYTDTHAAGGVTLQVLLRTYQQQQGGEHGPEDGRESQQEQDQQQEQQRPQSRGAPSAAAGAGAGALPFQAASHSGRSAAGPTAAGGSSSNGCAESGMRSSAAAGIAAASGFAPTASHASPTAAVTPASLLEAEHDAAGDAGSSVKRVLVQAELLVAADGPLSVIRQQCVGDGRPMSDGTLRWVGRLPGDLLSTIPVSHEAWWLGQGMTFNSHPLSGGDVAWEAQVSRSSLAAAGLRWDQDSHSLMPDRQPVNSHHHHQQQQQPGAGDGVNPTAAAPAVPPDADKPRGWQAAELVDTGQRDQLQQPTAVEEAGKDNVVAAAAATAAPAGDVDTVVYGDEEEEEWWGTAAAPAGPAEPPAAAAAAAEVQVVGSSEDLPERLPVPALLLQLFSRFPTPVLDMIAATPPGCILEAAVLTRPARLMPASMGRGGVAVVGEAAHPLRPTGQEVSQALEDAAELGAAVMAWGVCREALRCMELRRRQRWRHVLQVSQALGSCSNLGGVSLHQGLLDYTAQLHTASFVPLRRVELHRASLSKRLMRWAGFGLLAWGSAAALSTLLPQLQLGGTGKQQGKKRGPVGELLAEVGQAGEAAGMALQHVSSAVTHAPGQLMRAARIGVQAERGLGDGLGKAAHVVAEVAEGTAGAGGSGKRAGGEVVVHGDVPGRGSMGQQGPAGRFKDAVLGRLLAVGGVVSKPFSRLVRHRIVHEVAGHLGAF